MSDTDPDDLDRIDREIRANERRHRAEELGEEELPPWDDDEDTEPPDDDSEPGGEVDGYGPMRFTSQHWELTQAGVELPDPDDLDDDDLSAKLWEVIRELAEMRTFLIHTDHLSDRELYSELWGDVLHQACPVPPPELGEGTYTIDMVGAGSDDDMETYYRYYADEERRQEALDYDPDYELPDRQEPPYDRDRLLPREPREPDD